jgi:adenylate cyclase
MDALVTGEMLAFGAWRFDPQAGGLLHQNGAGAWTPVSLGSRARDILTLLLREPGALVSKNTIMDAVWPNAVVEPNNLTVQITALRRVLDDGRKGESCIQTVPGRGYRFALPVTRLPQGFGDGTETAPRLSVVVLPFDNLSGDSNDDYLAEAITDDLTSDLALIPDVLVSAREAANGYRSQPEDVRAIGDELRVRYALKGAVRRLGLALHVNVQLISAETGTVLWSDRFDVETEHAAAAEEEIVRRIKDELGIKLIDVESARSLRERPLNPDALDLVIRARSLRNQPASRQQNTEVTALLERALTLDPASLYAMTYIAYYLSNPVGYLGWQDFTKMQRAEGLIARARALAPESPMVLNTYVLWLRALGRCAEAIEVCQRAIRMHRNRIRGWMGFYHELGRCKTWMGQAEEGIALEKEANRLNPRSAWRYLRYRHIGWYSLLLGGNEEAIGYLERSLAINPEDDGGDLHLQYRRLAAAHVRIGNVAKAREYLASANRIWLYDTVRSRAPELLTSPIYVEQYRQFQDSLRSAGLRDHARDDADFGVPADTALRSELTGLTPVETRGRRRSAPRNSWNCSRACSRSLLTR